MSAQIDMTLHAPARLQIAAMLARADEVEFATIREVTEVSDSVLSKHLTALADAVREAGRVDRPIEVVARPGGTGRRGHLRVLPKLEDG